MLARKIPGGWVLTAALCSGLVLASAGDGRAGVQKRSGKREFPSGDCPVHLGRNAADVNADPVLRLNGGPGPGTFTATSGRALVSLIACDRLGRSVFDSGATTVKIDNFRVVRYDKFKVFQKQYIDPHVADPGNPYATDPSTCYADNSNDIFGLEGTIKVRSVFDDQGLRAAVKGAYRQYVPFEDTFEKGGKAWLLLNAEVEEQTPGVIPGNKALVLARSSRVDELGASVPADQCATAVVQVGGLKKTYPYVVDFTWNVNDFSDADIVLTVIVDTAPKKTLVSVAATPGYRGPSSTNGAQ